jgi:hypothetical protein
MVNDPLHAASRIQAAQRMKITKDLVTNFRRIQVNCNWADELRFHAAVLGCTRGYKKITGLWGDAQTQGTQMFFLLRMTFWLMVVLAVVPIFAARDAQPNQPPADSKFSAGDAFTVATETVSDLSQFCTRRPEACAAGAEALAAVGSNAQQGAKIVLRYLTGKSTAENSTTRDSREGSVKPVRVIPVKAAGPGGAQMSRETLLPTDLGPQWRGPTPG